MPTLENVTVNVVVDGQSLPEYGILVDPNDPSKITCWIESTQGKNFLVKINWDFTEMQSPPATRTWISCDGQRLATLHNKVVKGERECNVGYSEGKSYSLCFAPLVQTDRQEEEQTSLHPSFGSISAEIWRVSPDWVIKQSGASIKFDDKPIHEKKKIMGGHRVGLGTELNSKGAIWIASTPLDRIPYRTFIFYYRPRDVLQAQGIIRDVPQAVNRKRKRQPSEIGGVEAAQGAQDTIKPGPSSKSQVKKEREDVFEISDSDEETIQAEVRRLNEKLGKIRSKKIKREGSPVRLTHSGEVIDLTSD